ncbi:MAG: YdcF family protein [Candidatus Spyradenecus sp.]
MFALFKWLLWLCMPVTACTVILMAVALWLFCRRQWKPAILMVLALAGLLTLSTPWISIRLGTSLERRYPPQPMGVLPKADAIILLGGGIGPIEPGTYFPECFPAADRVVMAARLYHAGKAPLIIPTGYGATRAEKPLLEAMQVPTSAILCETAARDTAENATYTFDLLRARKCKRALVVTSAWHLPRTMMLFQADDIEFIPVGCDYEATLAAIQFARSPMWQKLPAVATLAQTSVYIKEYLGILFYSFRKKSKAPLAKKPRISITIEEPTQPAKQPASK